MFDNALRAVLTASTLAAVLFMPTATFAATISFTDAAWSVANGQSSVSVDGVTATAHPGGKTLTQSVDDGLGVTWFLDREHDEINNHEWLTIDFGGSEAIESVTIGNLFYERQCLPFVGCGQYYAEKGYYQVEGGEWTMFSAAKSLNPNTGELVLDLGGVTGSWIKFSTDQSLLDIKHDFSLASITLADREVPEPATATLFGLGLIGLARRLRRR